jgi:hypothetical protein
MKAAELAAWVGATSGLGSLLWNISTKLTSGPRLTVTAFADMVLMPPPPGNPRFLRITVQNVGNAATTLTSVNFYVLASRWQRFQWWAKLKKRPAETQIVLLHYPGPQCPIQAGSGK